MNTKLKTTFLSLIVIVAFLLLCASFLTGFQSATALAQDTDSADSQGTIATVPPFMWSISVLRQSKSHTMHWRTKEPLNFYTFEGINCKLIPESYALAIMYKDRAWRQQRATLVCSTKDRVGIDLSMTCIQSAKSNKIFMTEASKITFSTILPDKLIERTEVSATCLAETESQEEKDKQDDPPLKNQT